jgi:hypothetical protein
METRFQRLSLAGQIVEDLIFEPLRPPRFEAQLVGTTKTPEYKTGGFFVFSDLRPGTYTLRISGKSFQPENHTVTLPLSPPILDHPGDNELILLVNAIDSPGKKITFDSVRMAREIKAGVPVRGEGFTGQLAADLNVGEVTEAKLEDVSGLTVGSILRIIRDKSIRLKFDPYAPLPLEQSRIVGTVVVKDAPEIPLQGAQVRLTEVNGIGVDSTTVADAKIVSVQIDGTRIILGAEKDVTTITNARGDYTLYFKTGDFLETVTLRATMPGYQDETRTQPLGSGERARIDFSLASA